MSRYIIIGNGDIDNYEYIKKIIADDDILIAADGGLNHFKKLGLEPHYLIGDMDSVKNFSKNIFSGKIFKYPQAKNLTDSEIAIKFAISKKPSEIIIFGMTSMSRFDHSLSNVFLLRNIAAKKIISTLYINRHTKMSAIYGSAKINRKDGLSVSLVPLSRKVTGIKTKGLKYKLKNETLYSNNSRGISNILVSNETEIKLKKGVLLVIQINGDLK